MKTILTLIITAILAALTASCTKDELPEPKKEKPAVQAPKIIEGDTTENSGFGDF